MSDSRPSPVTLAREAKNAALSAGAALAGIVRAADLPEHAEAVSSVLTGAKSVLVLAVPHSPAALRSETNEIAQYDTMYVYGECTRAAGAVSRRLMALGFSAAMVPAFIPLNMGDGKKGMRGEICWRTAGVRAGLGSYGLHGLMVTKDYGSAVRMAGVVTDAEMEPDGPSKEDYCDRCGRCLEACPAGALPGGGKVNKKACGDRVFRYGYRFFERTLSGLSRGEVLPGRDSRELWQTLMTGNYYYCFACQTMCRKS